MTQHFREWIERRFPGRDYDDVLDFIDQLDRLDMLSKDCAIQALHDRYADEHDEGARSDREHEMQRDAACWAASMFHKLQGW